MTNKDFLKLLCISCGYSRNMRIESWKDSYGGTQYELSATDDKGYDIYGFGNFVDILSNLVADICECEMYKQKHPDKIVSENELIEMDPDIFVGFSLPWYLTHLPQSKLLDDKLREKLRLEDLKRSEFIEKVGEIENKYLKEVGEKPCKNCINKTPVKYNGVETEDAINENCHYHYTMSCEDLHKHMRNVQEAIKKAHESEEYKKLKEEYGEI